MSARSFLVLLVSLSLFANFVSGCLIGEAAGSQPLNSYRASEVRERIASATIIGWHLGAQFYLSGLSESARVENYSDYENYLLRLWVFSSNLVSVQDHQFYDRQQVDDCADHVQRKVSGDVWYFLGILHNNLRVEAVYLEDKSSGAPDARILELSIVYAMRALEECALAPTGKFIHIGPLSI